MTCPAFANAVAILAGAAAATIRTLFLVFNLLEGGIGHIFRRGFPNAGSATECTCGFAVAIAAHAGASRTERALSRIVSSLAIIDPGARGRGKRGQRGDKISSFHRHLTWDEFLLTLPSDRLWRSVFQIRLFTCFMIDRRRLETPARAANR